MKIISGTNNAHTMLLLYGAVARGPETTARGLTTRNLHNLMVVLDPRRAPLTSFLARNFNLVYAKKEWLWYLGADPKDSSIEKHAKMWQKIKQPDGSYYSNYGQYIFGKRGDRGSQFAYVIETLKRDHGSRRASIVLLDESHLFHENKDTVCTYAINFAVLENRLHMTVMMRSNDVVFGFTNDAFCFWNLYAFTYAILKHHWPDLEHGDYYHFTNSMHVYSQHYDMLAEIERDGLNMYKWYDVPWPTAEEAVKLIDSKGKQGGGAYTDWLFA